MKRKCERIILLGVTPNTDNYGVRVLLSSAVEILSGILPDAEVFLLDYGHKPEQWIEKTSNGSRRIKLINLRFSWRIYLPNNIFVLIVLAVLSRFFLKKVQRFKLLQKVKVFREILRNGVYFSIAGGDSFSDIYGFRRFMYVVLPQILVLLLDRQLILLPQTFGPFKRITVKRLARKILREARLVFSRDQMGVGVVQELVETYATRAKFAADLGFFMSPEPVDERIISEIGILRETGPLIGLNVSSLLYMGGYSKDNMFNAVEPYPSVIDAVVKHIVVKLSARVLLIPHVCGGEFSQEDETRLCKKLQENYSELYYGSVFYLDYPLDHKQMKTVIGKCDLFVGSRMHACIAAVSQAVPTLCLAYSVKFKGVMEPFQAGSRVLDLRQAKKDDILKALTNTFERRELMAKKLNYVMHEIQLSLNNFRRELVSGFSTDDFGHLQL